MTSRTTEPSGSAAGSSDESPVVRQNPPRSRWAGALLIVVVVGCGTPPAPVARTDAKLDLFNATARLEFDQGRPAEAAASYATALDRARELDDPAAVTTAAYNLAVALAATGDVVAARAALDEATHEARRANADPTDILLVRARVELAAGDLSKAAAAADDVLREPRSATPSARRVQAYALKGLAAARLKDHDQAVRQLGEAKALSRAADGPAVEAMIVGLSGEVASLDKDYPAAAAAFDRESELAKRAHDYRTVRRALAAAGRAYSAAGRHGVAADRLYRAARAAVAAGDRNAAALATAAAAAAKVAGDGSLIRLTDQLVVRSGPTTQPSH